MPETGAETNREEQRKICLAEWKRLFLCSLWGYHVFTSEGRKVKIYTNHGVMEFYGKLNDVMKELSEQFLVIHKSYTPKFRRL